MAYPGLHLCNKISRVPMTACLLGWKRTGFGFGCRVKYLVTVEIQCSQDYAQDDDKGVGGYGNGHDGRKSERNTQKKRETTLRSHDYGTSGSINSAHYVIMAVRSTRRPLHDTAVRIHSAWVIFNPAFLSKASPLPSMLSVPTMDAFSVLVSLFASLRLDHYPNPVRMRPISAPACPNP